MISKKKLRKFCCVCVNNKPRMENNWLKLKNEHERIQKKVFTNWINYYVPNCIEKDIITELRDGTKLIKLIEALTGEKLQCEKGKKLRRVHFISNVNKVLNYLEKRRMKLVNINSTDIVDGNSCIILGLIWSLILRFHITEYFHVSNQDISKSNDQLAKYSPQLSQRSIKIEKDPNEISNARQLLIDKFNRKFDLNIRNFKSDWRDGYNLLRIIDKLNPKLNAVNRGLEAKSNLERIALGLNLANDHLNVKKLLDAEDTEDEKSLITYLTQFLQKYPVLDINQNIQPTFQVSKASSQIHKPTQPIQDSSKLFEEQILEHECKLVKEFIDKVYMTKINENNLQIYSNQFNNLEPIYNKAKNNLSPDYQQKWNVIREELEIAKKIENWIKDTEQKIQNYTIPCSYEQCRQQLISHCNYFNKELNLSKLPVLIGELIDNYNQCINDVKKWKTALDQASKMWQVYENAKTKLMNWLKEADALLLKSHEPKLGKEIRKSHLESLKSFFDKRDENENILKEFLIACEDVLATLPEENKPELRSTLTGLVNRFYKVINYSAPQHLIKFEFDFIECDFFDKVRSLKNLTKDEQMNCESSIVNDLVQLENLSTNYWNAFNDKSLLDKAINHRKEWEKYKKRLDENYNLIKQTTMNLLKEAENGVNLVKNNDLKTNILIHNENLFNKIHNKLNELKNIEKANQLGLSSDLKEIENQINRLLEDLNLIVEDKILNWCKVKDRSRLPSPTDLQPNDSNNQKFLIHKIDFYSKLVSEFEKYEGLVAKSKKLIEELNSKLDELAKRPNTISTVDEVALNYRICSTTIESTIDKILQEVREINNRLKDHNYLEELHANEILEELRRLKQRNEEQYGYLIDTFSKDLLKQIDLYRNKCEHCNQIKDLRDLLLEVRSLNTTSVHKLEHLNITDALLHNKLIGSLEDLIKLIDEKCNTLMSSMKEEEKRFRITTELTQKKIVEEIDGKGERSNQIYEYNFKDLSNVNPFYQTTTTNSTTNTYTTQANGTNLKSANNLKVCQNDFGQQFNLSQENLENEKPLEHSNKKIKREAVQKESRQEETEVKIADTIDNENIQPSKIEKRRESYEIEAEKEREKVEAELKKEQERIENELKKERERLEEEAKKQREKLEEDARKERERIEEEMQREKERFELERLIEKDNELIKNLNELIDKLNDMISSNQPDQTTTDDLMNCLANSKQLSVQAKYVKDTQLNDKSKITDFETKLNETVCKLLALIESKIANDLGKENFDLDKIENLETEIVNLDDNINRVEYGFNLITNYVHCTKSFSQTVGWIEDQKTKINLLPLESIENLIDKYKKFSDDCSKEDANLEKTKDKLNSELKLASLIKTPYLDNLEQLKIEYTDKCKEIFDDFSTELKDKAKDIEEKAKECDSFNDFNRVNQELVKLRKNNESVLDKVKQEPNLEIISDLSRIDDRLDELSKKLENILDEKAVELVQCNEFTLEPSDLKVNFDNLKDKSEHYLKLQNEIESYKDLLIDNDIFLDNLRKKLNELDLKPVEEAIKCCRTYADNISFQIDNLQNCLKELNKHLADLGCLQELKGSDALNELLKLKTDYENKLEKLISELVDLVKNNLNDLRDNTTDEIKEIELQLVNLDQLSNKFDAKVNKLNLKDHPQVKETQDDLESYKNELKDKYEALKEEERLKEEAAEAERLRKLEEERVKKLEEEEKLRKLEEERIKKLEEEKKRLEEEERQKRLEEEERQRKLKEEEKQRKLEEERLRKLEEEKQKKLEEERLRKLEEERVKKLEEEERLKKLEEERLRKLEEERAKKIEEEERQRKLEEERLRKLEEQRKMEEERIKKLEEERKRKEEELKKLEEERKQREEDLKKQKELEEENDFSSAANLSKIDDQNEFKNDKKLKKLNNNKHQLQNFDTEQIEQPAVVQIKMPSKKSKALLTNTSRMYSVEHYSELEDSVDGEPIIELADSDTEYDGAKSFILEEIKEMLRDLKDNQADAMSLSSLVNEMKNIKNICMKVNSARNSEDNSNSGLDDHLKAITDQLSDIFNALKDILNQHIPNLPENPSLDKEPVEQNLLDSINLYTEIVTEFDKFDDLVNDNKEFIDEIYRQLNRIDNRSLDNKLVDYRKLLDKIDSQINNVNSEITNMNENLQDLKYKEGLDDRLTIDELEKLRKLCQFQMDNNIEDFYINYIKKLNSLESNLNGNDDLDDLENILGQICDLKEEIKDKMNNLELNNSPLIKNLLDQVEKLKNKVETKIEDLFLEQSSRPADEDEQLNSTKEDNLSNEKLERQDENLRSRVLKPLKLQQANNFMEFDIEKTPDTDQPKHAIFKQHNHQFSEEILEHSPPTLRTDKIKFDRSQETQMFNAKQISEDDKQLDDVLNKLRKLKNSLQNSERLSFEETKDKMNNLIELISRIQFIHESPQNSAKLQEVIKELNQVIDSLSKVTNDYIRKVCEKERTKPINLFNNMPTNLSPGSNQSDLNNFMDNLKPRFESITEYRKFEKLTENNQEKLDVLNKVINELSKLPIDKKIKNLKDCITNAEKYTNDLTNDVDKINDALRNLKLLTELKPNVTIEKYTEIKKTCRTDYSDLVGSLCKQAKDEINKLNQLVNEAKTSEKLKDLKTKVLSSKSTFEVEITTADLMNDLKVRETINEFKNLNKKIDERINRLIKDEKTKSPFNTKIKKETKSHLIKSNSATLVGLPRIESISTGNELIKLLKEMTIKLDKLIRKSNSNEKDLKSYLATLKEICNQSNYVRENEPQLNDELNLIDENLEKLRINLVNLITKNASDNLIDQRFEMRTLDFELESINFNVLNSTSEINSKKILEELEINSSLVDEFNKLDKLMNDAYDFIKDFEIKLDYLPLRTLEELLDNYKVTIFEIEILKAKILDGIEMMNSKMEDCKLDCELHSNPIIDDLNVLKEQYEIKCKDLFNSFSKEGTRKINEYIKKCTNCTDRTEFQFMLNEVKEFDVMNTNRINKIIQSTQDSLDKLLGKLKEDANNNNLETSNEPTTSSNLNSALSDSNNMIYVCDICVEDKCNCVPKLEETEIPVQFRRRNTRTKRGSSARNSLNVTEEQLENINQEASNSNRNESSTSDKENNENLGDLNLEELQFEIWLEAMSNTVDFLLNEKQNVNQNDFQEVAIYLKKMQNLKHALKRNFNHPANNNKAILNQYRIIYLTLEREICLLKRQVEKLRKGTPINIPIQDKEGRVVCQNGIHLRHLCSRRNFFKTLFKVTIPLQVIMLTLFGISSLMPSSNDDLRCSMTNSLRNSLGHYGHGGQPPL